MKKLEEYVRSIKDFPKEGIIFRDVTSVLHDADGLHLAIDEMQNKIKDSINKESKIIIFHPNNNQTWHCEIKDEKEIVKCLYAESFVKEVNKR